MKTQVLASPRWSTASVGHAAVALAPEAAALGLHLQHCQKLHRNLLGLQPLASTLRGFVTTHFMTTLGLIALLAEVYCRGS